MTAAMKLVDLQCLADLPEAEFSLLRGDIDRILDHPSYAEWLRTPGSCPFVVPNDLRLGFSRFGLVDQDTLRVKFHRFRQRVFMTDPWWNKSPDRVFPDFDESAVILQKAELLGLNKAQHVLVDPACGCGHHAIAFGNGSATARHSFDINERAIAFTGINSRLNYMQRHFIRRNDIREGLPPNLPWRTTLYLVNMPFALSALPSVLPLASDGGMTGFDLTRAALDALKKQSVPGEGGQQALVLCYSVGRRSENRWEALDYARQLFGSERVRFEILSDQKLWRVNGVKQHDNPMGLDKLETKADCRIQVSDDDRTRVRQGYRNLAETLSQQWDCVGYGLLHIVMTDEPARNRVHDRLWGLTACDGPGARVSWR